MRQIRWEEREEEDKKKNESCWNGLHLPGGFQVAADDEIRIIKNMPIPLKILRKFCFLCIIKTIV